MSDMETQSDSIDITSIKYAALGGFEVSAPAGSVSATADGVIFPAFSLRRPPILNGTCQATIASGQSNMLSNARSLRRRHHRRHQILAIRPWPQSRSLDIT